MLKIYHAPMTRSLRVIWLCEELGLPYEVVPVDFSPEYRATAEWRALNPVGKVPVMIDGNTVMFESGAMVQHLLDVYGEGRLEPKRGTPDHAHYLQWCWFGEATFSRPLGEIVNHKREFPGDKTQPAIVAEMADRAAVSLAAVADHTASREYLLGAAFTAADIMVGYSIGLLSALIPERMTPEIAPYWERLQGREGFRKAYA